MAASQRPSDEILARHEAGHVVAGHLFGVCVFSVTIDETSVDGGDQPIHGLTEYGSGFEGLRPKQKILLLMAGAAAESSITGDQCWVGSERDKAIIDQILMDDLGIEDRPDTNYTRRWNTYWREIKAKLRGSAAQTAIGRLATALIASRSLTGDEAYAIIESTLNPDRL